MRRALSGFLISTMCACGPLTAPRTDAGTGGGGSTATGGGSTATGGGGGGSIATGGGSTATGGGSTATGGGGGAATGGGGGGGGTLAPLAWASIGLSGVTSTSYIIGLSGSATDLWAIQDTGHLFHSTGAAFAWQFAFQYGAKDLYASGGTVVMIQTRAIRTCTAPSPCTQDSDFATLDLLNSGMNWNLFGEALCGRGPNEIVAIVSDTQDAAQLFEFNGTSWTRTNINLGIDSPRACWFDANGALWVSGEDAALRYESGAGTPVALSSSFTIYPGGTTIDGTTYVVGPYDYVARGTGTTLMPINMNGNAILHAAGGLRSDEVFLLGYYNSTNAVGNGFKWNGTALRATGDLLPGFSSGSTARVIHVTTPTEIFVAGGNGSGPLIARGRR